MTIKEMRAERERQEIGEKIREETTPADMPQVERSPKTTAKRSPKRAKDNTPQKISAEKITIEETAPHSLPDGLHDDITAQIEYYCQTHRIDDTKKIHPLEWQAVCMQIGQSIKSRGILRDRERERAKGGIFYDPKKMVAFLELYGYICGEFKQVAFSHNFPRFAGVSREYFHDYLGQGLTSSSCGLAQKAHELQKASLVGAVTGGGSATVGNIFLSKALAGLQETVTVQHVSAAAAPTTTALPVFDSSAGDLIDSNGD